MHIRFTTLLIIMLQQINKIFTQGMSMSPCPRIFQYRFDGQEWFGVLSVRNPNVGEPLHLRLTLSLRGKPATSYLGEIEMITRGQYQYDVPVLYKVKFPISPYPPKLMQITTNNQVICMGPGDRSIFVTQIQLEHTRKFTFMPGNMKMPVTPTDYQPSPYYNPGLAYDSDVGGEENIGLVGSAAGKYVPLPPIANTVFDMRQKPPPAVESKVDFLRSTKDICGRIDNRIRYQALRSSTSSQQRNADAATENGSTARAGAANIPLVIAHDPNETSEPSSASSSMVVEELPAITRGAWPWLAAVYVNNLTSLAFQCSGTLISTRVVISSAHCFKMYNKLYTANEVLIFLGRHNLKNWNEEGSLAAPVDDIFIHPDFDSNLHNYDADIAVVVLKNDVRFSTFIRPACMWSGSSRSEYIEGESGIVVGWGLRGAPGVGDTAPTVPALATTVPKIIDAPIVSNEVCFQSNDKFRSLSSNRTFCAGVVLSSDTEAAAAKPTWISSRLKQPQHTSDTSRLKFRSGPCPGDSGAGLMIYKNNRWLLRGTVSASLPTNEMNTAGARLEDAATGYPVSCNVNQYVVYTDVAKFSDWILAFTI